MVEPFCPRCDAPLNHCDCPELLAMPSTDRQRIELAMELIAKVPGKSVSGARSLLKSALKRGV